MVSKMGSLFFGFLCLLAICMVSADTVYVGTESSFLYIVDFDGLSGRISLRQSLSVGSNPSFLDVHPSNRYLYAVSEVETFNGRTNSGGLLSFRIEAGGALSSINSVPSLGGSPCYLEVDQTGRWLLAANYMGGNYGVWQISSVSGAIDASPVSFQQDTGRGPNPNRQEGPHAHQIVADRTNSLVVIPDLGIDKWMQYDFDELTGKLTPGVTPFVTAAPGSGPRHIVFHPSLNNAYGINELTSTVTVFAVEFAKNTIVPIQSIILTPNPGDDTTGAEVQISPDGNFLYGSNRPQGRNGTIAIFSINQSTGALTSIGYADTYGQTPRFFTFSPSGEYALVANQNSNNIVVFRRDAKTGAFGRDYVSKLEGIQQPSHILFL